LANRKWLILILCLLPFTGRAAHNIASSANLPFASTHTYDTVIITGDSIISPAGTSITFTHKHCILNLNGKTLFTNQSAGTTSGIQLDADSLTIINGTLEQSATAAATSCRIINIGSGRRHTTITNVNVHARGYNSGGVFSYNNPELEINGGNWTSYVSSFARRDLAETAPIRTDCSVAQTEGQFGTWVHHVTIDSCPHMAISLRGGKLLVDSNTVTVDGQNTTYSYPSTGMYDGWSNNDAIAVNRIAPGSHIIGNIIRSGTNHGGGRAIAVGNGQEKLFPGSPVGTLEIAYNDVDTHVGPDPFYSMNNNGMGFRIKDAGLDTLYFHHNTIIAHADTAVATLHTGPKAAGLWMSGRAVYWRFEYNTIKSTGTSGLYGYKPYGTLCPPYNQLSDPANDYCGSWANAVVFDDLDVMDSVVFKYNRIESNVFPISWGELSSASVSADHVYFYNDTIKRITPSYVDQWGHDGTILMGRGGGDGIDNSMTDPVFEGDTSVVYDESGAEELTLRKTFRPTVVGADGVAIVGARVRIRNAYGTNLLVDTTGAGGTCDSVAAAIRYYHQNIGSDLTYGPFIWSAIYGTDSVGESKTFLWATNGADTINMSSVTLTVTVRGSNTLPVPGVSVYITNALGTLVGSGVTDPSGIVSAVVTYGPTYNPFALKAKLGVDSTLASYTVSSSNHDATLTLTGTYTKNGITIWKPRRLGGGYGDFYSGTVLGIPRDRLAVQDGQIYVVPKQQNGSTPSLYHSSDTGLTFGSVVFNQGGTTYGDMHVAIYGEPTVGIHLTAPGASGQEYRLIHSPCTSSANVGALHVIGTTVNDRGTVAAHHDTTWAVVRNRTYTTFRILMSTDTFTTYTNYSRTDLPDRDHRVGLFTDDAGTPNLFYWDALGQLYKWPWHSSGTRFRGDTDSLVGNCPARIYSPVYTDEWNVFWMQESGGVASLVHARDTGSSWVRTTISTGDGGGAGINCKAGTRNDSIFVVYSTNDGYHALKVMTPAHVWWTDSLPIGAGYTLQSQGYNIPGFVPGNFSIFPAALATTAGDLYVQLFDVVGEAAPAPTDTDGDGIADSVDNCPYVYNPAQTDADVDGVGDLCDTCTDTDADGYGNPGYLVNTCPTDNCPTTYNPLQEDADADGIGDSCDVCTDTDADGYGNPGFPYNTCALDNCPLIYNPSQADSNGNGIGDTCDVYVPPVSGYPPAWLAGKVKIEGKVKIKKP